jgi:hypothetical protein
MSVDLNAMAVFAAIADAKGFRAAGECPGVSASAVPVVAEARMALITIEARRCSSAASVM